MKIFNKFWEFRLENDGEWQHVKIPHDWMISDTKNLYKDSVGLYRKKFQRPKNAERVFLRFDGVYQDSELYVNDKRVGEWKNGYTAFSHEITEFLRDGENEVLVKVNYQSPNTRWYSGAGIYRDCWLICKGNAFFKQDGIYISTDKLSSVEKWKIEISAEVEAGGAEYEVRHNIPEIVENPRLWDIDDPYCYTLKSELLVGGVVVDTAYTRFGFRETRFTRDGFFLNGRRVPLNGVCHHHDLGALGSAVHKDAIRRQLLILKNMGVNAIRTAHNPHAAVFMELCDEMGFLVMTEFTDVWKKSKTKYDYARFFEEWAVRDVASWVRRDRNCPSLIMWSIGNEIYDTHENYETGSATTRFLMEETRRHDPAHNAEITICSNWLPWENTQKCADLVKLVGYNYADNLYTEHSEKYPDWKIYGGETAAIVQSRGVYHFPLAKALLADDDLQCSALGNSATSWGAKSTEAVIAAHADNMGQFIWTGFDYIGEPTPYHTKNSYFGQIDTAGFEKDSYYIYKAAWDTTGETVLHLYPYWDWSLGQPVDVRIASNAPKTELFLNGKSLGTGRDFIVPYEPGVLKAIAYDKNGKVLAETERKSFGDAENLAIDIKQIGELAFVEITTVDKDNNPVENANNRVIIDMKNGELLGLDNGDSTDYDQYQNTNHRRLFNGKLIAIIKKDENDKANFTLSFDKNDIPIRKIELLRDGDNVSAKIHPQNATHKALEWRLSDAAGIDSPLARLTVDENDKSCASLQFKGDGEVYVRCTANNGRDHVSLISVLPVQIDGYGKPFPDPYSFISGGLYNAGNDTVTNGNERGIATARDRESIVGFTDLDFGKFGADEITLWLFPLSGEPFDFEIWRGLPDTVNSMRNFELIHCGGELLLNAHYDKGTIWNTYQEVTYKLPQKLHGIQTLGLVFRQKVHIKGFRFKSKTYEKIPFAACDNIYGDSYEIIDPAIEKIGNNVTITFAAVDFEKSAQALELSWRSRLPQNTIRMIFTNDDGEEFANMLTLPESASLLASAGYAQKTLPLQTSLNGKGQVSFIFLPGSEIDLEYLRFTS
ncbi:MAG: DUF4982 domain-containing protein [Defluviitaleaceae bacterium]|nr:DUF4982 domain-containing protein [Defluviitaleaceae bacterium]